MTGESGKTLQKLVKILDEKGFRVDPYDTVSHLPKDCGCSWAAIGHRHSDNQRVRITSKDTMGACAAEGIAVEQDQKYPLEYTVSRKGKTNNG